MARLDKMAGKMVGKSRGVRKGARGRKNVVSGGRRKSALSLTPLSLLSPLRGPKY